MLFLLMLVWGRTAAEGATYTWDGGGGDNNWSTDENWNPSGAPVSDSNTTVVLDGEARTTPVQNIANPFELNRLEILNGPAAGSKAAFSLSGGQLQFLNNGTTKPRIYSNREATSTIGNNIDIPNGETLEFLIGTYHLNLNGIISGDGSIDKLQNAGGISLFNSANSFSGGLTIRGIDNEWYKVNVYASGAMGTGPVNLYGGTLTTNAPNPGGLVFYNTTSHTNVINLFQNSPIFAALPVNTAIVTLNGNIDLNAYTLTLRGGGTGTVYGAISEGASNAVTKIDTGTWLLSGENTFTGALTVTTGILTVNGSVNANIRVQAGASLDGSGTLKWHAGEKVEVAGTMDISQLKLDLQVPDVEGEDFVIADYGSGSIVGSTFASVTASSSHFGLIYDSTNKLIILHTHNRGTVIMVN